MRLFLAVTIVLLAFLVYRRTSVPEEIFLRTEKIFDSQSGRIVKNEWIQIKDGKILSLNVAPSSDVFVIDLRSKVVLPGLIDLHTHLFLKDPTLGEDFSGTLKSMIKNPNDRAKLAEARGRELLVAGFTAVRDLGNSGLYLDKNLREKARRKNVSLPLMFISGPGLTPKVGQFAAGTSSETVAQEYLSWGENAINDLTKKAALQDVDWIKVYADEDPSPARAQAQDLGDVVAAARTHRLPVAGHATFDETIHRAIAAGVQSIEHGYEASAETLKLLKQKSIWLIPTDYFHVLVQNIPPSGTSQTHAKWASKACKRLALARRLGVPLAFGSDNYFDLSPKISYADFTKQVLYGYSHCGLTAAETLQTATINAALVLNRQDLGRLGPGARADIIAVEGDPLENLRNLDKVKFVMKEGFVHLE